MTIPDEPPALAYIEKTLADSYRKEIDQEENVWRTLPFFAATLALQLAALFQIIDKLPDLTVWTGWLSVALLGAAGIMTMVALSFLAASIYPAKFEYVAKEPALLAYAMALIGDEQDPEGQSRDDSFSAPITLKHEVARQYAQAADHNRQVTKRRQRWRAIAGLAALGSVAITVFLVGTTYAHYLSARIEKDHGHAAAQTAADPTPSTSPGADAPGHHEHSSSSTSASDAGGHEGLVGAAQRGGERR